MRTTSQIKSNSNVSTHWVHFHVFYDIVPCQRRLDVVVIYKNSAPFIWLELVPGERGFDSHSEWKRANQIENETHSKSMSERLYFDFSCIFFFTLVSLPIGVVRPFFMAHRWACFGRTIMQTIRVIDTISKPLARCLNICLGWFINCITFNLDKKKKWWKSWGSPVTQKKLFARNQINRSDFCHRVQATNFRLHIAISIDSCIGHCILCLHMNTTLQSTIYIWSDNDTICSVTKWHFRCIRMLSCAFAHTHTLMAQIELHFYLIQCNICVRVFFFSLFSFTFVYSLLAGRDSIQRIHANVFNNVRACTKSTWTVFNCCRETYPQPYKHSHTKTEREM